MTISNTSRTAGPFIGNGATNVFPFSFKVFNRSDVLVASTVTATGVETTLTLDSDYTVTLNSNQDSAPGGIITTALTLPSGSTLAATSNIDYSQNLDLTNLGGFYPESINDALDRTVIQVQQLKARVGLGALNVGAEASLASALGFMDLIKGSTGTALVGYIQAGAGAVVRKLQDRLRENVSVFDYMTGTQVADVQAGTRLLDVTSALQAALNYVASIGGVLNFPPGQYKTSSTLIMGANDVKIRASTKAVLWPTSCHGLQLGNPHSTTYTSGRANNISVENLQINMTNAAAFNGINVYNTDEYKAHNVSVFYGAKGMYMFYVYNASLYDCVNILSTTAALELDGCCDKTLVVRGQYGNTGNGIIIRGGKAITIQSASVERNQKEGIVAYSGKREAGAPEWPDNINIKGCYVERNCQASGDGAISLGVGTDQATTGDYSKGHVIEGNFLNHDANNPRANTAYSMLYFGKCSEVSVLSNRYVNSTNYAKANANTYLPRMYPHNDLAGEALAINTVRCEIPTQVAPVEFNVSTDANGNGTYPMDLTSFYKFTTSWVVAGITSNVPPADPKTVRNAAGDGTTTIASPVVGVQSIQINANNYTIKVYNGPANSTVNVTAFIMGKLT